MDDAVLVELARRGDRDAFTAIVIRYQDQLYTMALRLLGRRADAADVVQETFLRAFVSLPKLRGVSVRGWLFRVAVNAARDVQRRTLRRPELALEYEHGRVINLPDPGPGPEERALTREWAAAIRAGLMDLPAEFRIAVVLRDVNDLSYAEIAHALAIPMGTAKSRVARGRDALAGALGSQELLAIGNAPAAAPGGDV